MNKSNIMIIIIKMMIFLNLLIYKEKATKNKINSINMDHGLSYNKIKM